MLGFFGRYFGNAFFSNSYEFDKKLASLRKEKERLSLEKMFLYDKYRSGKMIREQFKAEAEGIAVRIEEIGREKEDAEAKIERVKFAGR